VADPGAALVHLGVLAVFIVAGLVACLVAFQRRLSK
jgi:Flp pilus assembly pilin Flp